MSAIDSWSVVRDRSVRLLASTIGVLLLISTLVQPVSSADKQNLDGFAKCLASKNVLMYGSFWCLHCDDQKELFGASFKFVPYVECSIRGSREMTFPCKSAQIRQTPTWVLANGERLIGLQPLKTLSEKTGCSLP